jgi:hypothetical protein
VEQNPRVDRHSFFFGFFQSVYVDSVVMAIRRQVKVQKDSVSLAGLLTELAANPELVTRSEFVALYGSTGIFNMGESDFSKFASAGAAHIDPSLVLSDLASLRTLAASSEEYADRRIAHWDKREPTSALTAEAIFEALDELGRLVRKYYLLFFATSLEISPIPQGPVFHVFAEPWLPRPISGAGSA